MCTRGGVTRKVKRSTIIVFLEREVENVECLDSLRKPIHKLRFNSMSLPFASFRGLRPVWPASSRWGPYGCVCTVSAWQESVIHLHSSGNILRPTRAYPPPGPKYKFGKVIFLQCPIRIEKALGDKRLWIELASLIARHCPVEITFKGLLHLSRLDAQSVGPACFASDIR